MLLGVVAFDMFAVGLIVPLLTLFPAKTRSKCIADRFFIVRLRQCSDFSAPLLGWISDRVSRRDVLFICILAGAFGYGLLGIAQSLRMVLASRVIVGVARQTQTISKAWLSDLSTKETRLQDLSWFSATVSIGFMLGPTVGGKLAKRYDSYYVPFTVAFILFLFNSFLIRIALPPKLRNANSKREVIPTENVPSKTYTKYNLGSIYIFRTSFAKLAFDTLASCSWSNARKEQFVQFARVQAHLRCGRKGRVDKFFCRGKRAITTSYHLRHYLEIVVFNQSTCCFVFFFDKRRFCYTCILFCKGYIYALFGLRCGMFVSCTSQHVYAIDTGCR